MPNLHAKVILLGQSTVGKSSLIKRFFEEDFSDNSPPTFSSVFMTKIFDDNMSGNSLSLNVWDTCGQEKYMSIASLYYKDAHVVLLVIDVDNPDSLEMAGRYLEEMNKACNRIPYILLVANKIDLLPNYTSKTPIDRDLFSRCSFYNDILDFKRKHSIECVYWTTAKDDRQTVQRTFDFVVQSIFDGSIKLSSSAEGDDGKKLFQDSYFTTKKPEAPQQGRCC